LKKTQVIPTKVNVIRHEMDHYISITVLETLSPSFKPLDWWKTNSIVFPHLAVLARKFLCIPGKFYLKFI
jgi:hypothetical protein